MDRGKSSAHQPSERVGRGGRGSSRGRGSRRGGGGRTIAQRLDHLIDTVHPSDRGPLSYMEIAEGIRRRAGRDGPTVSHATIHKLRTGEITDPRVSTLQVIAGFFGVPVSYFLDDAVADQVDASLAGLRERVAPSPAQRELMEALRDGAVREVAVRMNGLSAGSLAAIRGVVDQARRLEGLPEIPRRKGAGGTDG